MTMTSQSERDKLKVLAERIAKAKEAADPTQQREDDSPDSNQSKARMVRIGTDFIATILGSLGLGWFVDQQFEIAPWGMIGFLVVGFIAACYELVTHIVGKPSGDAKPKE